MAQKDNAKQTPFRKTKTSNKRTLVKNEGTLPESAREGRVIANIGAVFLIRTDEGKIIESYLGGTVISEHTDSTVVAVGDKVWFLEDSYSQAETEGDAKARILKVGERVSLFSRKTAHYNSRQQVLASNIDNVLIMMAADDPPYNKKLIDRYLVSCEIGEVHPIIVINKSDLLDIDIMEEDLAVYEELGYELHIISLEEGIGLDELIDGLKGETTLISGPSGAGKSSFLNYILDGDYQDVGEVSEKSGKGQHTTSFSRMFELPEGGFVIDSPGIRELAVWGIEEGELQLYYHDFDPYAPNCKYPLCSHVHEPGCAVAQAVEEDKIDYERYTSYLNFLDTLESS